MKKLFMLAALLVLAGCGEKGTTYTCEINTKANDLALISDEAESFPEGTSAAKIILNDNVMSIPALGKNGYKSHILKEMKEDNEPKFLQKGDLIYDTPDVTEAFLVNRKEAIIVVEGKWMQEFSNCKK